MTTPIMPFEVVEQESSDSGTDVSQAADAAAPAAFDYSALLDRLSGDESLVGEVIGIFLEDCPIRLAAIKAAVDRRDAEALRTSAHALKGAAGSLAAHGLFEAARALERIGAEQRMDAAEGAWRLLSAEAANVIDAFRRFEASPLEDSTCAR